MLTQKTLTNGIPFLQIEEQGTNSITVLVLVGAGSRYESKDINGISHFLEHMFFKGAKKYKTPKEVSLAIDSIGGEFNAFTDKEYAGYYVKVAKEHVERAFDVLSDMLIHSRFPEEEIEKERGVIIEEMHMYQDSPRQQVFWDFENHLLGDQPIGWDEIGTKEVINTVTRKDFLAYKDRLYQPGNIVIATAGAAGSNCYDLAEKYFAEITGNKEIVCESFNHELLGEGGQVHIREKATDQAHVILGVPGVSYFEENQWSAKIFNVVMGGNMSSRMFQHLREEKGLCYSIFCGASMYSDIGLHYTKAGLANNKVEEAIAGIISEYRGFIDNPITDLELRHAKEYIKGSLALSMEDTEAQAHFFAKRQLLMKDVLSIEKYIEKIEQVSLEDVIMFYNTYMKGKKLYMSIIGPFTDKKTVFEKLLSTPL